MPRLHIPDIGDTLVLARPWSFSLYPERRNASLIAFLGWACHFTVAPSSDYTEDYRAQREMELRETGRGGDGCKVQWKGENVSAGRRFLQLGPIPLCEMATLPAGTILQVDRIYIRKGARDFSSLSFIVKGAKTSRKTVRRTGLSINPGASTAFTYESAVPARAVRFWAKLADVNTMEIRMGAASPPPPKP